MERFWGNATERESEAFVYGAGFGGQIAFALVQFCFGQPAFGLLSLIFAARAGQTAKRSFDAART